MNDLHVRRISASDFVTSGYTGLRGTQPAERAVQKHNAQLSVRDGDVVIGDSPRTEQKIRVTSLYGGCQRLMRFDTTTKAFSEPNGSWVGCKWRG